MNLFNRLKFKKATRTIGVIDKIANQLILTLEIERTEAYRMAIEILKITRL